ncbi:Rib/alpha-like domain-containing protein, partial [Enterococcus cecorum]|uniref:Rib/alpha-like domain-containing protein n=1 Tax=Enterococcus cecorum TaxID=44008 RepID=UPI00200AD51A
TANVGENVAAESVVSNLSELPAGTTVEWVTSPDTSKVGTTAGIVKVTYPDGSSETANVTVTVQAQANQADQYTPEVSTPTANVGANIAAESVVSNLSELPAGTTVEWLISPDTSKEGITIGSVKVMYPDGSSETTIVVVRVEAGTNQAAQYTPEVSPPTVKVGTSIAAESVVSNLSELPAGTTVEWVISPDTSKAGTTIGVVKVTYPDGSNEIANVQVTVIESTIHLSQTGSNSSNVISTNIEISSKNDVNNSVQRSPHLPHAGSKDSNATTAGLALFGLAGALKFFRRKKDHN